MIIGPDQLGVTQPVSIFRNGCTESLLFARRRSDWLEQLREYAASNEIFCLFTYHHPSTLRVMKFFVYSITTTLPHPELHVKETKFVENKMYT